jgi:RimJ/RimL family protein N-acetyltransferase
MKILFTERLLLRWFTLDDAAFILELVNDPSWIDNIGDRNLSTIAAARDWIEGRLIDNYRRQGMGFWAVERREDGVLLGMSGLVHRATLPEVDVGYAFLPRFWGMGYAKEATAACLDYGQHVLGLDRILAITAPHNQRSARLLGALGLRFEGARVLPGEDLPVHLHALGRAADAPPAGDDRAQIDSLVRRFFSAFTSAGGACPTVAALPFFFLPRALITRGDQNGLATWHVWEFISPRAALLASGRLRDFVESEVEGRTEIFGQIAQRWVHYRKSGTLDGVPFTGEGRKTLQLVRTAQGWKIAALAWEDLP